MRIVLRGAQTELEMSGSYQVTSTILVDVEVVPILDTMHPL